MTDYAYKLFEMLELTEERDGFTSELAADICEGIVSSLKNILYKTTDYKIRQKLDRQIHLYRREQRKNKFGSDATYCRTRKYHNLFKWQLAKELAPAINNGAVRRPYRYVRWLPQSLSPQ